MTQLRFYIFRLLLLLLAITSFSKIALANYAIFAEEDEVEQFEIYDPFEKVNREIYKFNIWFDKYSLLRIAEFYKDASTPEFRKGTRNFIKNIELPFTIFYSLLQGKLKNAGKATATLILNTSFGVLGFHDVARDNFNIKINQEDLGQTLAVYGFPSGPYLMLPFFGPFTVRSLANTASEVAYPPVWHFVFEDADQYRVGLAALDIINIRERLLAITKDVEQNALDPYSVYRTLYVERRENLARNE